MRSGPPGPSIVSSRTAAISAGGAIRPMRTSYCARATGTDSVCVAGTPVPLSNNSWICGSTGIGRGLLHALDNAEIPIHGLAQDLERRLVAGAVMSRDGFLDSAGYQAALKVLGKRSE